MTRFLDFYIPELGITRGQAIAIQADLNKRMCYLCKGQGSCTVLSHGDTCNFKPTKEALKIDRYLVNSRG